MKPRTSSLRSFLALVLIILVAGSFMPVQSQVSAAPSDGSDGSFGYTWTESPLGGSWVDASPASGGQDTGLVEDDASVTVPLGFTFRFYGVDYTQVTINTNGMVSFGLGQTDYLNTYIPKENTPNNFIAAFWDDLFVGDGAKIYYRNYTDVTGSYFVIEWYQVTELNETDPYTFELILKQTDGTHNSEIRTQYENMTGALDSATVGVEDQYGIEGLECYHDAAGLDSNRKIDITNSRVSAYVSTFPLNNGNFSAPDKLTDFPISVTNSGNTGSDSYDFSVSGWDPYHETDPGWLVELLDEYGAVPLADTNGNGDIDTGTIVQGATKKFVVRIKTPSAAVIGDMDIISVVFTSHLDTGYHKTITFSQSIPSPFAQIYRQDSDGTIVLATQGYGDTNKIDISPHFYNGNLPVVIETPAHTFFSAWSIEVCLQGGDPCDLKVTEIEYSHHTSDGYEIRRVTKLLDYSGVTMPTQDLNPTLTVLSGGPYQGQIGILWTRILRNTALGTENDNVYFAILDPSGMVSKGPFNVTNNPIWGRENEPNFSTIKSVNLVATGDNHFVLSWSQNTLKDVNHTTHSIFTAAYNDSGTQIQPATSFLALDQETGIPLPDTLRPNLAVLNNNKVLISWYQAPPDQDVFYNVLDSSGHPEWGTNNRNLSGDADSFDDGQPDAVQLANGRVFVAWPSGAFIRFAFLDSSYQQDGPFVELENPSIKNFDLISVTTDQQSYATITSADGIWDNRIKLYYALVDGDSGSILTDPMVYQFNAGTFFDINNAGYGNTSFSQPFTQTGTDFTIKAPALVDGVTKGSGDMLTGQAWNLGFYRTTEEIHLNAVIDGHILASNFNLAPISATFDPGTGSTAYEWIVPASLGYYDFQNFSFKVSLAPSGHLRTPYAIQWTVTAPSDDNVLSNNSMVTQVIFGRQMFLPIVRR